MHVYPFDVSEEAVLALIRRTASQYRDFESRRVAREIKLRLRFHCYNTTGNLVVTATRCGVNGTLRVYVGTTAPSGRPYELETTA